ncbi:hypothetical protein [Vibrio vulnificus]|uniref:hypothetical protein n=1 Tax=Vibrio vulnificus TaxID=672 RepID=UPI00324249F3
MYKRIKINKGNTVKIEVPINGLFRRVINAYVHNGNGIPIARFQSFTPEAMGVVQLVLSPEATARLHGHYKYEIVADIAEDGVKTLQYGILEVM